MKINFDRISRGTEYSRHELAELWGYKSADALRRGVVTPAEDKKIIIFLNEVGSVYENKLEGEKLTMEGPNDHFAEERMLKGEDEVHVFFRREGEKKFIYEGEFLLSGEAVRLSDKPTRFYFSRK